jgi:hypothetical protein
LAERHFNYLLSSRDCARLVHRFDFVFVLGRGAFFFFGQPAEEAALVLWDGLSATMEMSLSSVSFLMLLLLICSSSGGKKGVLKVNRAEERGGTKFSSELTVGTKSGHIWYFFWN